ncbi:hypothetical protein RKE32_35505 [Streptomyces sp. Li-HN-5-13]|nr:hypothetical protein RKE32_35505 [Streptomyces sp. Li-HN-5-13]
MVVHEPLVDGGRQVSVRGETAGVARSVAEVVVVVRRVGIVLDPEEAASTPLIEWRGADAWACVVG